MAALPSKRWLVRNGGEATVQFAAGPVSHLAIALKGRSVKRDSKDSTSAHSTAQKCIVHSDLGTNSKNRTSRGAPTSSKSCANNRDGGNSSIANRYVDGFAPGM